MGGRGSSGGYRKSTTIRNIEDRIRNDPVETAALVNDNGDVLFDKSDGLAGAVYFTPDELDQMKGATLTHNHPGGSTFSGADIDLADQRGLKEIRATHSNGTYVLTRTGKTYPTFADNYDKAVGWYMKNTVDKVYNSTGDHVRCNKMVADYKNKWLHDHASKYGWKYREVKNG